MSFFFLRKYTINCFFQLVSGVDWDCLVREGRGRGRVQRRESGEMAVELFVGARDKEIGGSGDQRSQAYYKFR